MPVAARETVLLAVLDGVEVVSLARHGGTQPIRLASDTGRRMPAVVTALGKAVPASLPVVEMDARLAGVGELPFSRLARTGRWTPCAATCTPPGCAGTRSTTSRTRRE
ncbi:IclR family transcriptional regulator domain-containing protein [Lentzea albida]|uniref:IclR family transcriptional regulator domain-containing protein n=1 Tax=Lentzea albida TaxID=65499 RepID=UPI003CCC2ADC